MGDSLGLSFFKLQFGSQLVRTIYITALKAEEQMWGENVQAAL